MFILAISDLIVGVGNDAVNFLNSSIGSKASSRKVILIVASFGVFFGALFSSGMMEVARKGLFNPDQFYFSEVMLIFLAVMITDVLLLDLFNTLGLPTSTTVSMVFELLGAAIGMAIIKVSISPTQTIFDIYHYINSGKALAIIGSILSSVIVSFIAGIVLQFIIRSFFTFNYDRTIKYFGGIWSGVSVSFIIYFILVKGVKGSAIMSDNVQQWITTHSWQLIFYCFIVCSIIFQLLVSLKKINILRYIVLFGTFALALAFAGNDLVNFIGVPLAGLKSFTSAKENSLIASDLITMDVLKGPVKSNVLFLFMAGIIMTLTLWFSKKARTVTKTEINLSRQESGEEIFGSSVFSRALVRWIITINRFISSIIPKPVKNFFNKRFDNNSEKFSELQPKGASYDLVRASVNLTISTILIAFATSLKLPLSTTYVTFMVAMGTSLADGAWGRESAVYRITGVFTVISGWFLTAFIALTISMIIVFLLYYGEIYALIALIVLSIIFVIRTHQIHKKREGKLLNIEQEGDNTSIFDKCLNRSVKILSEIEKVFNNCITAWINNDRKSLRQLVKDAEGINFTAKKYKDNIHKTIEKLTQEAIENSHYYVQASDYQREIAHNINFIVKPIYEHIENNHQELLPDQKQEVIELSSKVNLFIISCIGVLDSKKMSNLDEVFKNYELILNEIDNIRKKHIKRIKKDKISVKNSLLYFNFLSETKNLVLNAVNLLKSERDFIKESMH
jgi:phosphate/sulfate permease